MIPVLFHVEQHLPNFVNLLIVPREPWNLNSLSLLQQHSLLLQFSLYLREIDVGFILIGEIDAVGLFASFGDIFLVSTCVTQVDAEFSEFLTDVA